MLPAILFALLFNLGLYAVTTFNGIPAFPGPWETPEVMAAFFRTRSSAAVICAAFQFGAAIPLGIYAATVVSRLQFLGVRAAGTNIALFGGFATALNLMASSAVLWAMSFPAIADSSTLTQALYRLLFVLGGVGFSVPLGLLIGGISITALSKGLLPKWLVISGLFLAVAGELSWLDMLFPQALFLVPLTRFPGFVWLIVVGFVMPTSQRAKILEVEFAKGTFQNQSEFGEPTRSAVYRSRDGNRICHSKRMPVARHRLVTSPTPVCECPSASGVLRKCAMQRWDWQ